jgi:hypothetical protein
MTEFSIASPHKSELWYDYRLYANLIEALESLGYKYRKNAKNRIYFLGAPRRNFYPDVGKFDANANNIALVYCHFEKIESFSEFNKVYLSSPFVKRQMWAEKIKRFSLLGKKKYIGSMSKVEIIKPFSSLTNTKIIDAKFQCDLSFIGSPRIRPIVEDIIPIVNKHNLDFHLYGPHWEKYAGDSSAVNYRKANSVDYFDIPLVSHNSKISLVDHHQTMNDVGSVSHKYVDIVMSGGFVICDNNKDADTHYKGIVYSSPQELEELVLFYLNNEAKRQEQIELQHNITAHQTTLRAAKKIAETFI